MCDEETSDTVRFTSATYDANGNLLSYTDERGNTTSYTYDGYGNTTSVTDAKGTTTYYTYTKGVLTGIWQESGIHIYYDYTNGLLTAIRVVKGTSYSQSYNFTYNSFGKLTQVSLNTSPYISYTYESGGAGALTAVTYQNGDYEEYTYDMMGNVSSVKVNGTTQYTYVYDYMGNLLSGSDAQTSIVNTCKYNRLGTMVSRTQTVNGTTVYTVDEDGNYTFADGAVTPDVGSEESYDVWDRITSSALTLTDGETTNTVYTVAYTYLASANSMTDFIGTESFSNGSAFSYTYDANSNLTSVKENGILKISYTYDSNNQLIREDNAYSGKTTVWTYDANGNILSKKTYAYTTGTVGTPSATVAYAYGNSSCADLLTSYNGGTITYDAAFLPQNWRNASSLTWEGRNLTSLTLIDGPTITYTYDGNGIRTGKTVGTDSVQYVRDGSKLLQEIHSDYTITFLYDDTDALIGFRYGGNNYYYGADSLGVIHYVYSEAGSIVVTYTYDAWGNTVSATGNSTLIAVNPIRYKSYYYDSETGFFYLQSRYYDPAVGRFVNADDWQYLGATGTVLGCNLFAYCSNNPIYYEDSYGLLAWPGEIHNQVVKHIAMMYSLYMEQKINYKIGWGRADLISSSGYVWEVKRAKTSQINSGKKQVKKYIANTWAKFPKIKLQLGYAIPDGAFIYRHGYTTYHIWYHYEGEGVISYDYIENTDWYTLAGNVLGVVVGVILISGIVYLMIQTGGAAAVLLLAA